MYESYLEIYQFAISIPDEKTHYKLSEAELKQAKIPLYELIGRKFFWSYLFIYIIIYVLFIISSLLISWDQIVLSEVIRTILGILLLALLHGWLIYLLVKKYHKANKTLVFKYGKLSYDELYPKGLRRRFWIWNIIPFLYLTIGITPIVTRLHHLIVRKLRHRLERSENKKKAEEMPRLEQYELIKNFIHNRIKIINKSKIDSLSTLKILFERRISEIRTDVQRISIILSSLGIVISLFAFMVKDPIIQVFKKSGFFEILIVISIFGFIIGIGVYFITQLHIQIGKNMDLSVVLDAIDTMISDESTE